MHKNWQKGMAAAAVVALLLSGCGQKPAPQGTGVNPPVKTNQGSGAVNGSDNGNGTGSQTQQQPHEQQDKQLKMKAYYGDAQMEKLVEKEVTITYKQEQDKYMAALKALTTSSDTKVIPLLKGFNFKSAALKNGGLTIDLSMAQEARLGAGGEEMILSALQKTLFQFVEVQTIDILLDGKKVESLMGHMDLPHPIKRS